MPQLDSLGNESMLHTRVRPHYVCRHLRPPGSILVANSCFIHRHTRLHYANGGAVHYSAAGACSSLPPVDRQRCTMVSASRDASASERV